MGKIYWIAYLTLVRKELMRFINMWRQTLIPPAITMVLYFVIFGHLVGSQIPNIHGYQYMQYIAPGLIMMSVINNAYANVSFSFFLQRFQKSIHELIVAPIPNALILLGFATSGVLRGLTVGVVVTLLALCFTHLHAHNIFIIAMVVVLSALMFSLGGFTSALFAKDFDDVAIIPTFVLTPLTYLGGVFYSISILPPFWHHLSLLNPILYMVNTFRYGILGISDISIYWSFIILIVCSIALFFLNLMLLNKGKGIRT